MSGFESKKGRCSICGTETYIVNANYKCCNRCNKKRLAKRSNPTKEKRKLIEEKKKDVYAEMAETREHVCSGCGTTQRLSHSHIIPISRRPDLATEIESIVYDCLSIGETKGCHEIYEHGTEEERKKLLNYEERMDYIEKTEPSLYKLLTCKSTS